MSLCRSEGSLDTTGEDIHRVRSEEEGLNTQGSIVGYACVERTALATGQRESLGLLVRRRVR